MASLVSSSLVARAEYSASRSIKLKFGKKTKVQTAGHLLFPLWCLNLRCDITLKHGTSYGRVFRLADLRLMP